MMIQLTWLGSAFEDEVRDVVSIGGLSSPETALLILKSELTSKRQGDPTGEPSVQSMSY